MPTEDHIKQLQEERRELIRFFLSNGRAGSVPPWYVEFLTVGHYGVSLAEFRSWSEEDQDRARNGATAYLESLFRAEQERDRSFRRSEAQVVASAQANMDRVRRREGVAPVAYELRFDTFDNPEYLLLNDLTSVAEGIAQFVKWEQEGGEWKAKTPTAFVTVSGEDPAVNPVRLDDLRYGAKKATNVHSVMHRLRQMFAPDGQHDFEIAFGINPPTKEATAKRVTTIEEAAGIIVGSLYDQADRYDGAFAWVGDHGSRLKMLSVDAIDFGSTREHAFDRVVRALRLEYGR